MNTSISLAVPDRRSNDERNAEKLFQSIISYCQQVIESFILFNIFLLIIFRIK